MARFVDASISPLVVDMSEGRGDLVCSQPKIPVDSGGSARFRCTYDCVVMRPFKGEVIDCAATQVTAVRSARVAC